MMSTLKATAMTEMLLSRRHVFLNDNSSGRLARQLLSQICGNHNRGRRYETRIPLRCNREGNDKHTPTPSPDILKKTSSPHTYPLIQLNSICRPVQKDCVAQKMPTPHPLYWALVVCVRFPSAPIKQTLLQ